MEKMELTEAGFWQDDISRVMVNQRDPEAVNEAGRIRRWLDAGEGRSLQGHLLFSTSGSSGGRKWVALSKASFLRSAVAVNRHLEATADERWMLALPTFHVGGMAIGARAYAAGSEVVVNAGKWDPVDFGRRLEQEGIGLVSLVPTQLVDLLRTGVWAPSGLRKVLIGGGRLSDEAYTEAVRLGWPVVETYGMTETGSQVATSAGIGRELRLLPIWQARLNAEGQLMLRGEAMMSGYVRCDRDSLVYDPLPRDGWFVTGDVVEIERGVIRVIGRADRCVKVLGELVSLDEVADQVQACCAPCGEVVVMARADERAGAVLWACVEGEGLRPGCLDVYHAGCHPLHRIEDCVVVDELPRSPLGKVRYGELERWFEDA